LHRDLTKIPIIYRNSNLSMGQANIHWHHLPQSIPAGRFPARILPTTTTHSSNAVPKEQTLLLLVEPRRQYHIRFLGRCAPGSVQVVPVLHKRTRLPSVAMGALQVNFRKE